MDRLEQVQDLCLRMEDMMVMGNLPRFDRAQYDPGAEEVWFLWEAEKFAVVVELGASTEQLARALADAGLGDPVLN